MGLGLKVYQKVYQVALLVKKRLFHCKKKYWSQRGQTFEHHIVYGDGPETGKKAKVFGRWKLSGDFLCGIWTAIWANSVIKKKKKKKKKKWGDFEAQISEMRCGIA